MGKETLLKLQDISVHLGGIKALDNANVYIDTGEIVTLMGPNGAGKSTIFKTIFGLAPISSGKIFWHQQEIQPIPYQMAHRGISFVPQGRRIFRNLNVYENLEIGGFLIKNKKEIKERVSETLGLFPILKTKLNSKSSTLSGGQQQMLAIARGLITNPSLLLLDEPTLGLAPMVIKEVFEKIKEINERHKMAIIIVEHNIKSLLSISDRAYILDRGKIAFEGSPQQITDKNILRKIFMGK